MIQQRPGGRGAGGPERGPAAGPEKVTESHGLRRSADPERRGSGHRRAPTFPAFWGAPLAPGAGSLFLNRSCYLGVVFPIVPDQELLARCDWLRGEKRQEPSQSERRLLAGGGGVARRRPARQEGLLNPLRLRAGWLREGTLCWREDLTSLPPPVLGVRMATRRDYFKLTTAIGCRILVFKAPRLPRQKEK